MSKSVRDKLMDRWLDAPNDRAKQAALRDLENHDRCVTIPKSARRAAR